MKTWYQIFYQANRHQQSQLEPRGFYFGSPSEAAKWLGNVRRGHPYAATEGWYLWDTAAQRWF
jgi:hypothetical protein